MAACLITISGTSGEVLLQYLDSTSASRSLIAGIGTLYLEDDGSDYTWTTISGDAVASSGCVTLTEVESICYIIDWEQLPPKNYVENNLNFDAVILGSTVLTIDENYYPGNSLPLAESINALNSEVIKATGYKTVIPTNSTDPIQFYLILKVQGTDIPYVRITNPDSTHYIYLKGTVTSNCLPAGYTLIDTCSLGTSLP